MMRALIAAFFMLFCCTLFCADNSRQMESQDLLAKQKAKNLPLFEAITKNNLEDAKKALKAGAIPDAEDVKGIPALHHACKMKKIEIAQLLLDEGADPNKVIKILNPDLSVLERSILGLMVKKKKWPLVFLLRKHGAVLQPCDPPRYQNKINKEQAKLDKKQAKIIT